MLAHNVAEMGSLKCGRHRRLAKNTIHEARNSGGRAGYPKAHRHCGRRRANVVGQHRSRPQSLVPRRMSGVSRIPTKEAPRR